MASTKLTPAMLRDYPDLMEVRHLQEILHIGRQKAYALVRNKEIPSLRVGRTYRIPKAYLLAYLNN